jgi:hypothetical protein
MYPVANMQKRFYARLYNRNVVKKKGIPMMDNIILGGKL